MPVASRDQLALLLQLAMQEQAPNPTNGQPRVVGRPQSALALNAYVDALPSAGEKDADFQRQRVADLHAQDDEEFARNKARLSDPYEAAKAAAQVRSFETRRNVGPASEGVKAFTPENFMPVSAHGSPAPAPRVVKGIRRLTDAGGAFTDPDAAMTATQKAMLTPAGLAADSRKDIAELNSTIKTQTANATTAKAQETRDEVNRLAQEIHDDPYLNANVGVIDAHLPTIRAGSADFQSRVARLKALLSLESRSKLKGQGAISDKETQMLTNSVTSLTGATDEAIFRKELQRIMEATKGSVSGASSTSGAGEFDYVDGKLIPRGGAR